MLCSREEGLMFSLGMHHQGGVLPVEKAVVGWRACHKRREMEVDGSWKQRRTRIREGMGCMRGE
jgi:hypothetical protein